MFVFDARAQIAPTAAPAVSAAQLARYDTNKNGVLDPAEAAAMQADQRGAAAAVAAAPGAPSGSGERDVIELSPFTVNTDKDSGFMAANAGTATRLSLDMKDVPAPYSVMTRDFIDALGLTSVQQATMWAVNGGPVPDGNAADQFGISTIVQVRGVVLANGGSSGGSATTRNNYLSNAIQDSYNLERYEFGRGPNAALFSIGANSPLGGSLGSTSKSARYDRSFDTIETKFGSWDYKRATLDVNRPLTDRLAVRGNAVWMDRGGYKHRESEKVKGITGTASYLITPKTEVRVEAVRERFERSIPMIVYSEFVSGWDGVTVFRGPVTNNIFSTTATPGAPNPLGQTLTLSGTTQGVDRRGGGYYLWDPSQNMIMNFQNEGITRRADDTPTTPMLANGVLYTRGTGLPFGNSAAQTTTPTNTTNGGSLNFLYQMGLPDDRFSRAISGSRFRLPSKRDNQNTDSPTFRQDHKDFNTSLTHQIGDRWFFEVGGDVNETKDRRIVLLPFQETRIDINQLLPNGANNPHYLWPYADSPLEWRNIQIKNRAFRYNAAYKANLGKWGDYVFNFNGSYTTRRTHQRFYQYSMHRESDARLWTERDNLIRVRHYWYEDARPFGDAGVPNTVFRRDFAADNNSWTTSTETVNPAWVLLDNAFDEKNTFFNNGVSMSAKYLEGKLVLLGAYRFDKATTHRRNMIPRAYLSPTWDGSTPIFRADAPEDFSTLTYIPRDASGNPTSTIPIPAQDRPTIAAPIPAGLTAGPGNVPNPIYASDRFRNDYSPPKNTKRPTTISVGPIYNVTPWLALVANYATSYQLPPTGRLALDGSLADVQIGSGYDLGTRLRLFGGQIQVNAGYYYNKQKHQQADHGTRGAINALFGRNAYIDPLPGSRNNLGFADIVGTDYASQENDGFEFEMIAALKNGLRLTWNVGSGQLKQFDRFPGLKAYVPAHADDFRRALEAAGGRLNTSLKPDGAPNAPGRAEIDPARPNSGAGLPADQLSAITDYNNIWVQYEAILTDKPIPQVRKIVSNAYADYTFQSGRLRGVRVGLGVQYRDDNIAGYRTADTVLNSEGVPVLQYGPVEGLQHPIFTKQPLNTVASLAYTTRLKTGRWKSLDGKQVSFQLNINNVLNKQAIIYQDDTVVPRPPNGDFTKANRVSVQAKNAIYQEPISFIFTTTLRL